MGKTKNDSASMVTSAKTAQVARWLVPISIVLLTFAAFLPALHNGFVNWDDGENLLENLNYRGLGWTQLHWMFTTFHMSLYRPLTWVTLGLDYLLWEMNPFGYHLTNLLLHAVNAALFYFINLRLVRLAMPGPAASGEFPFRMAAGFAALLFSLHPLRVEPAAWTSARNDVLSGLFFLWTILCYLRATAVGGSGASRWRWMTAAVIVYGMSLLSKAIGMTLPVVLLVLDVYPLRRLGGGPGKWFGSSARSIWWEKIPFLLLALGAGVIGLVTKQEAGAVMSFTHYGIVSRVSQALFGLAFYLWKTLIPFGLSPLYELPLDFNPWDWRFLLSGLAVLAASIGLFGARHRWPAGLASWVCYVTILSPILGIAQSGPQLVADRYSYLSCLGWAVLAGAGAVSCWKLWVSGRIGRPIFLFANGLAAAILLLLGILTWRQTQIWHDSVRLWRHTLAVARESSIAHNNLANALLERSEVQEAIEHYREALQINPAYAEAHYNLGNTLVRRGELEGAIGHFRQALQIDPAYVNAHNNLGNALVRRGELEEAIGHFRQALRIDPVDAKAHYNLGTTLARKGDLEEAIQHFHQALQIDPAYAKARYNLGVALAIRGDLERAIAHFRQAVRIQPEFAAAHESLGRALAQQGKRAEAIHHYQEALRIMKSRPEAQGVR